VGARTSRRNKAQSSRAAVFRAIVVNPRIKFEGTMSQEQLEAYERVQRLFAEALKTYRPPERDEEEDGDDDPAG